MKRSVTLNGSTINNIIRRLQNGRSHTRRYAHTTVSQ